MTPLSRAGTLLVLCVAIPLLSACGDEGAPADGGAGASTAASGGSTSSTASQTSSTSGTSSSASSGGSSGGAGGSGGTGGSGGSSDCPPTFISKCGTLLFADDFESGDYKPEWTVVGGTWSVDGGKLVGSSPAGEPDPNIGHMVAADRVVIRFSFSYAGTGDPGIRLNHKEAASPQHLLAVRLNQGDPTTAVLREMSGWASTTQSNTLDTADTMLDTGVTYVGVLEVFDRNVSFSIDGQPTLSGMTVDQSAHPKNHMVLAAYGASVTYDDVEIWEALAP